MQKIYLKKRSNVVHTVFVMHVFLQLSVGLHGCVNKLHSTNLNSSCPSNFTEANDLPLEMPAWLTVKNLQCYLSMYTHFNPLREYLVE